MFALTVPAILNSSKLVFGSLRTFSSPEWEIQDRVLPNQWENAVMYFRDRTINTGFTKMYDTKFRSLGGLHYYHKDYGYYPAIIDLTEYQGEVDYHVSRVKYYEDANRAYFIAEDRHAVDTEVWTSDLNYNNVQKIQIFSQASGGMARGVPYRTGANEHIWLFQRVVASDDLSTLSFKRWNEVAGQYDTTVDICVKEQTGKRNYGHKPYGLIGADPQGYYHIMMMASTNSANEELYHLKTLDWDTFTNYNQTHSFTLSATGSTNTGVLRANGYKVTGVQNSTNNLGDFTTCVSVDGTIHVLWYEDYHDKLFYIKNDGTNWVKTEISLGLPVSGYTDKGNTNVLATSVTTISMPSASGDVRVLNVGAGNARIAQISSYDAGARFRVRSGSNYFIATGVYDNGTGLLTLTSNNDIQGSGSFSSWEILSGGLRDGVACLQMVTRGTKLYAAVRVILPNTYRKIHLFESTNGLSWTFKQDLTPGVNDRDIHKCMTVENFHDLPNNSNTIWWTCDFQYKDTDLGLPGNAYGLTYNFTSIKPEVPDVYPSTFANRAQELAACQWSVGYNWDDVTGSPNVTQLNDVTGNGRHGTVNGSECYIINQSIRTFGQTHIDLPVAAFQADTSFTLAFVCKPIGEDIYLSFGNTANAQQYLWIRKVVSGVMQYLINYGSASNDFINGFGQLLGNGPWAFVINSNGKHLAIHCNDLARNKEFSLNAPLSAIRWASYYPAINNMKIGARITTTSEVTPLQLYIYRYKSNEVISYDNRRRWFNYVGSLFGITLRTLGTATTYEPESERLFARMSTPPTTTQMGEYDSLIVALKNALGLPLKEFNLGRNVVELKMYAHYNNGGDQLLNWLTDRFDSTLIGSPAWTLNRGYAGSAGNAIDSNFNNLLHNPFSPSESSIVALVSEEGTPGNNAIFGAINGGLNSERIFPRTALDQMAGNIAGAASQIIVPSVTAMKGFHGVSRVGGNRTAKKDAAEVTNSLAAQAWANVRTFHCGVSTADVLGSTSNAVLFMYLKGRGLNNEAVRIAIRDWAVNIKGVTGI
jgi:hypothetical protein